MASSTDRAAIARSLERNVDLILLAVIIFAVAGATIFVMSVTIGDWEFWADWKDVFAAELMINEPSNMATPRLRPISKNSP